MSLGSRAARGQGLGLPVGVLVECPHPPFPPFVSVMACRHEQRGDKQVCEAGQFFNGSVEVGQSLLLVVELQSLVLA